MCTEAPVPTPTALLHRPVQTESLNLHLLDLGSKLKSPQGSGPAMDWGELVSLNLTGRGWEQP